MSQKSNIRVKPKDIQSKITRKSKPKITLNLKSKSKVKKERQDDNSEEEEESIWDFFPDEILLEIGYKLSYNELITIRMCSKRCLKVFSDATLISLTTRQKETIRKMVDSDIYEYNRSVVEFDTKCVISCGVGTGKTVIALNAIRRFLDEKKAKKILICAPRMLFPVWEKAFKRWCSGLPELYEFMVGTEDVKKKNDICLHDKKIVITKNGLSVSVLQKYRTFHTESYHFGSLNKIKPEAMSSTQWVLWKLCQVKWDVIICDDMNHIPKLVRALQVNLRKKKHNYRLFSLNASNRRVGNLVNYGVDEELPDKPKLTVNLYSFKEDRSRDKKEQVNDVYLKIKEIISKSESETRFGIYDNGSNSDKYPYLCYNRIRQIIFDDYENLDVEGTNEEKCKKMEEFGKDYNFLFSGKKGRLIKGHNLYPQEVNYIVRRSVDFFSRSIKSSLSLSNIYQALGRCHRTFSPYKEVTMNIFVIYHLDYAIDKFKFFFGEYFLNKNDNFSTICKRINGMRTGQKMMKEETNGESSNSRKLIKIQDYLMMPKFNKVELNNESWFKEDGVEYGKYVFKLKESA